MVIYTFKGEHKNKSGDLLKKAVAAFTAEKMIPAGTELFHSISHTGSLWGCLVSERRVGFDLEIKRDIDCFRLAERFFLEEEIEYVRKNGIDGFFDVWVIKEACVKYYKTGLMKDMKSFRTSDGDRLSERIKHNGDECFVYAFEYCEGVKCGYCCDVKGAVPEKRVMEGMYEKDNHNGRPDERAC